MKLYIYAIYIMILNCKYMTKTAKNHTLLLLDKLKNLKL